MRFLLLIIAIAVILMLLASSPALAGDERVGGFKPAIEKPRMHFADTVSGKPFSKDPAVVRFQGRYWLD